MAPDNKEQYYGLKNKTQNNKTESEISRNLEGQQSNLNDTSQIGETEPSAEHKNEEKEEAEEKTSREIATEQEMLQDPEGKLDELKRKVEESEIAIGELEKKRDTANANRADLQQIVEEIVQVVKAYSKTSEIFEKEIKDIESYSQIKTSMIDAAIQEKKEIIDSEIGKFEEEIAKMKENLNALKKKYETAEGEYKIASKDRDVKQGVYDSLKTIQKDIENRLKELKILKESIEKEEEKNNATTMYFLISEFNHILAKTSLSIKKGEELKAALDKASMDLYSAKETLREKEEQWKTAKKEFETKQQELEALWNKRREIIKKRILDI